MPKVPIDYTKTIIYKIEHIENDNLVYVGFTTNWDRRKCEHKRCCNNENGRMYNLKLYQMIRANGGWDAFKMIEVEKYACNDKREAEKRETEIMKELKANMNMVKSFVSDEDKKRIQNEYNKEHNKYYKETHKEHIKKVRKEYCEKNKKKIQEYQKEYDQMYRQLNKDKIKQKFKEYREKNNEILKEKKKRYYEANKDIINEKRRLNKLKKKDELKNNM